VLAITSFLMWILKGLQIGYASECER
jgi:hypothetical protein